MDKPNKNETSENEASMLRRAEEAAIEVFGIIALFIVGLTLALAGILWITSCSRSESYPVSKGKMGGVVADRAYFQTQSAKIKIENQLIECLEDKSDCNKVDVFAGIRKDPRLIQKKLVEENTLRFALILEYNEQADRVDESFFLENCLPYRFSEKSGKPLYGTY